LSATPILDLEQPPPQPSKTWRPKVIGFILGFILTFILILAGQDRLPRRYWPQCSLLLLIPALYVAIAIHEAGHLIAGKIVGLDLGGISVGAFTFAKSGKNWVFRFDRRQWLGGFFKPLAGAEFHSSQLALCVAWGPLVSLLLTIGCGFICARYGSGEWYWIGSVFWASLFILLTSAIPFSAGLSKSDGARLWQLLRYPERAHSWIALLDIQTEEAKGVRPHEWRLQTFKQILAIDASANEFLYCQLLAYYRRLDEGREVEALGHLENALAKSANAQVALRQALFLEAACSSAIIRMQASQAHSWRERACKLRKPESLDVVDAAIAMCEGRYQEAVPLWETARARVVRRKLDSGLIRFAKDKWAEYEAVCRAAEG
jgi:hypothetical protein